MLHEIKAKEAQRRLSSLVREMERRSDVGYQILVGDRVVAELRNSNETGRVTGIAALLRLSDEIARRGVKRRKGPPVTSENYKEFLYGNWPPPDPRKRR